MGWHNLNGFSYYTFDWGTTNGTDFKTKKNMANTKQKLTRAKLIELRNADSCARWQDKINELLKEHFAKNDDFEIEIDQELISELITDGTAAQRKLAKDAGLKLTKPLKSSDLEPGEIMKDEDGDLVLITDDGFVDLQTFEFHNFNDYDIYGKRMPKNFKFTLLNKPVEEAA